LGQGRTRSSGTQTLATHDPHCRHGDSQSGVHAGGCEKLRNQTTRSSTTCTHGRRATALAVVTLSSGRSGKMSWVVPTRRAKLQAHGLRPPLARQAALARVLAGKAGRDNLPRVRKHRGSGSTLHSPWRARSRGCNREQNSHSVQEWIQLLFCGPIPCTAARSQFIPAVGYDER
jgi:hypothetical protein